MRGRSLTIVAAACCALAACVSSSPAAVTSSPAGTPTVSSPAPPSPDVSAPAPPVPTAPASTTRPEPSASTSASGTGPLIVLDPGHDGGNETHTAEIAKLVPAGFGKEKPCNTTGTNTDAGYPEHAFNWSVALDVRTILLAHGVRVVMTRHNDTRVGPCVNQRAAIENSPGVVAAIAIHADGAPASGHGFHVNYASRRPDGATAATMTQSLALSTALHNALAASSGLVPSTYIGHDGYFARSDFADLNLAKVPATFLELGNMRNAGDARLQTSAAGRERIAKAVAAGILAYLATLER